MAIDPGRILAWLRPVYEPVMHDWFTYSPEFAQTLFRRHFQAGGEWADVVRELNQPGELTFLNRVNLGIPSVLGHLRCTGPWATIMDELWSSNWTVDGRAR